MNDAPQKDTGRHLRQAEVTRNTAETQITVRVDTEGFAAPAGTPAAVTVDVACTVDLSDVAVPGLPGSRTLTDSAVSPLDPARGTP